MNNTKLKTPIIFMSVFIFSIFTYVSIINIFPNKESDSYLSTENSLVNASIENTKYQKGNLIVTTTGEAVKGCVKSTKTTPDINSNCWIKINNYQFSTSILKNKTYYIWLMDNNGLISNIYEYHSK